MCIIVLLQQKKRRRTLASLTKPGKSALYYFWDFRSGRANSWAKLSLQMLKYYLIERTVVMMVKLKKGQAHDLTKRRGDIEPYLTTLMQIFQNPEGNICPAEAWQQFQCTEITMTIAQRNSK